MHKRILYFLNRNGVLHDMQYGFRAGRSCEHELLNVQRILSRHQVSILLFTDFIEAFDIEDHSILMMKI